MKGQSSMEVFITIGIVIAFTIPVLFLLLSVTSVGYENTAIAQADASARSLADSLNFVYYQGPGAKRTVLLNLPPNTERVVVTAGEATVTIRTRAGEFDAVAPTFAKISSRTQQVSGTGLVSFVIQNNNGEVEIVGSNP
ncbi:hypothetical protein HZC07_02780 [Candidatus Micrarchaeota archaeon]|nr:hypothetical protein [Candidatus Micrarchaeota archaeon]